MVREVKSGHAAMAIADMDVMTEIDGPQAVDRLVADLAAGTSCETRRPLLVSIGPAALDKVTAALAQSAAGPGRACLIEALAALMPAPTATGSQPVAPALGSALAAALLARDARRREDHLRAPGSPAGATLARDRRASLRRKAGRAGSLAGGARVGFLRPTRGPAGFAGRSGQGLAVAARRPA